MGKSMKSGAKAMSKGALSAALAAEHEMKPKQVGEIIDSLVKVGTAEVKKSGKFVIPGLCMIKTRMKAAQKAGKKMIFGKEVKVKAKPAKTVVKAFAVKALKNNFLRKSGM